LESGIEIIVKEEQDDRALNELFRQKLGGAEVIPSSDAGMILMRKLARREFLRFNPARFNIWYAGGIAAAGAALALILTSGPGDSNEPVSPQESTIISTPASSNDKNPDVPAITDVKADERKRSSDIRKVVIAEKPSVRTESNNEAMSGAERSGTVVSTAEVPSVPEGGVLPGNLSDKSQLQSASGRLDNLIAASATEGCTPFRVQFKNRSLAYDSCMWSFGDGGYSRKRDPEWIFDIEGEYEVMLRVYGKDGKHSFSSIVIRVHPKPVARFEISPEAALIPNDGITFLNYSFNADKYRWDFGDGASSELFEPKHFYKRYGNYNVRLKAYSVYGCSDSLVVQNAFGSGYYVKFPNAFIPNPNGPSGGYYSNRSDEYAYVFHPVHSGVSEYQMKIFSRRGILVFETNDINIGWDGYYKGQLVDAGVYIWKVRGNYINGEQFTLMGDVTLLKNQ